MIHVFTVCILLAFSHMLSFWVMTEPKYSVRKTMLIYSVFCTAFVCILMLFYAMLGNGPGYYAIGFTSTIIVAFVIFVLASADPLCKKIFLFISYANVFSMFVCISLILCSIFFKGAPNLVIYYARNIIRTFMFIPTALIYIHFLRPTVRAVSGKQRKTWYSIAFVSLLFLVIFALFLVLFHTKYEHINIYIPFFAASVLLYCSTLWVIFGTIQSMIDESNTELINQNVAYLQGQLKTAKENELSAKTIRHDIRHHNQNIAAMLKNGEIREAMKYLEQYDGSLDAARVNEFCSHITVNAILSNFYNKAQSMGISVSVRADTNEATHITDMDFVAVLSNLLENAVNGCAECGPGGEIKFNIRTVADKTVIVCSNPCKKDISIENNMIKNRGIGIASMLSAIRKYDGNIKYSLDSGVLTACIILNS